MGQQMQGPTYRSTGRFLAESIEGLLVSTVVLLTWFVSKRWLANLGSENSERARDWPGDGLVSDPETVYTRAITIDASPDLVWSWIVQFGLDRAGFYSYELLERVAGIPVRNVESVIPEMQTLEVGDEVRLHPKAPGIPVADVVPGKRLCFGVSAALEDRFEHPDPRRSWSMYLEPRDDGGTRLLLRGCIGRLQKRTLAASLGLAVEEPIDFVMEQRMLRTIRRLGEADKKVGRLDSPPQVSDILDR